MNDDEITFAHRNDPCTCPGVPVYGPGDCAVHGLIEFDPEHVCATCNNTGDTEEGVCFCPAGTALWDEYMRGRVA